MTVKKNPSSSGMPGDFVKEAGLAYGGGGGKGSILTGKKSSVSKKAKEKLKEKKELTLEQFKELSSKGRIRHTEKKKPDSKVLKNAETPYEYGKAYGYSKADIAHFYAQRRGGGDIGQKLGHKEFIADQKKAKTSK